MLLVYAGCAVPYVFVLLYREQKRQQEIAELTSQGKIPHEVELGKHPEKSLAGLPWLMGKVAGAINVSPRTNVQSTSDLISTLFRTSNRRKKCESTFLIYMFIITHTCSPVLTRWSKRLHKASHRPQAISSLRASYETVIILAESHVLSTITGLAVSLH